MEVVEFIEVTKSLPLKPLPLKLLDLVHGFADHLQYGLMLILHLLVGLNEKICYWNLDPAEG